MAGFLNKGLQERCGGAYGRTASKRSPYRTVQPYTWGETYPYRTRIVQAYTLVAEVMQMAEWKVMPTRGTSWQVVTPEGDVIQCVTDGLAIEHQACS